LSALRPPRKLAALEVGLRRERFLTLAEVTAFLFRCFAPTLLAGKTIAA
jgi:hypothetical protein